MKGREREREKKKRCVSPFFGAMKSPCAMRSMRHPGGNQPLSSVSLSLSISFSPSSLLELYTVQGCLPF